MFSSSFGHAHADSPEWYLMVMVKVSNGMQTFLLLCFNNGANFCDIKIDVVFC